MKLKNYENIKDDLGEIVLLVLLEYLILYMKKLIGKKDKYIKED